MEYMMLTQDEMDDAIVRTLKAREVDHFMHAANVERYTNMLATLPEGKFKDYIAKLVISEDEARINHEHMIEHTRAQLPKDQTRVDAAMQRMVTAEATAATTVQR